MYRCQGRCALYYSMAHFGHGIVQCAPTLTSILLMMDAKGVRNMYRILVVVNKHNTARVTSCWFIIYYILLSLGELCIRCRFYRQCESLFHSLPFFAAHDHCPPATLFNVSAHRVFGRPVFLLLILTSHTVAACAHLRCSILATWHPNFHLRL